MTQPAEIAGTAFNATAVIGSAREDMTRLHQLQLADLEARELVDRMKEKVGKCAGHLDSAKQSLADAEEAAKTARDALEAHQDKPGTEDEADE